MGGQVLGGGVIVLVAVLLWLLYLLPSMHSRRQYDAAERNAVRLNQALRVLAETSETPREVHLELTARTALAQQKLARRALAEREHAALEEARVDLERARDERAAARATPAARQARARRRLRLTATVVGAAALAATGVGAWQVVTAGASTLVWWGPVVAVLSVVVLTRMSVVGARAGLRAAEVAEPARRVAASVQDLALPGDNRAWAPRRLPQPLTASAGSQAAATLDAAAARAALRQAAVEEAMRQRAEAQRPPSIDTARPARQPAAAAPDSAYARMGFVDDDEIEAHVRRLLAKRAVGQ